MGKQSVIHGVDIISNQTRTFDKANTYGLPDHKELNVVIVMKLTQGCTNLYMDSIRHNMFIFIKILNSNKNY